MNLVTYTFLFSFRKNQKRESNFQQVGGLATKKFLLYKGNFEEIY